MNFYRRTWLIIHLTSVASIAPIADASVAGIESNFTDSTTSELRLPNIWWWPLPLASTRMSSNWCLEPTRIWMEILDVRPWLEGVAAGDVAVWPTEEDVTCRIEAADVENIAPQSAVGEFSGVLGCELWFN